MSKRSLPAIKEIQRPTGYAWETPSDALTKWAPSAAEANDPNTIDIFDFIGEDFFGDGFNERRLAGALRKIGVQDVTVNINSPGGDMFAGLAIYNLLREHPAKVTVKVMGLAASAASVIAMAGDDVLMGTGSMMMIHRAWGLVIGNSNDFADAQEVFNQFDKSMGDIYAARTGNELEAVMAMLDGPNQSSDGTWLTAADAVEKGFADGTFDGPDETAVENSVPDHIMARRQIETDLGRAGVPRVEREKLINTLLGARDAAPAERDAGENELATGLKSLIQSLTPEARPSAS